MKQAPIVPLPTDIEEALEAYRRDQGQGLDLGVITQDALREFLAGRGYLASTPPRTLRITPAEHTSGATDVSVNHDRYFAEEG